MRCASFASCGNPPPMVTPGRLVATSPVMLRYSTGAVIFGSNVSTCVAPPERNSTTTVLSLMGLPAVPAIARDSNNVDSVNPPRPSAPA